MCRFLGAIRARMSAGSRAEDAPGPADHNHRRPLSRDVARPRTEGFVGDEYQYRDA